MESVLKRKKVRVWNGLKLFSVGFSGRLWISDWIYTRVSHMKTLNYSV